MPAPPTPRSENATPPSLPYTALAGTYTHPAYGALTFCLFSGPADAAVKSNSNADEKDGACAELPLLLPGVIDPDVPTLIARWDIDGDELRAVGALFW